jgi:hypothetical protein
MADVSAPSLHEMRCETTAVWLVLRTGEILGQMGKIRVKQAEQRAKRLFLATVGRGGYQEEVPAGVNGKLAQELMPLVPAATTFIPKGTGMRLVHEHQFRAGAGKLMAPPI